MSPSKANRVVSYIGKVLGLNQDDATPAVSPEGGSMIQDLIDFQKKVEKELTKDWVCIKRNGSKVPFDAGKIRKALYRCFNSSSKLELSMQEEMVEDTTRAVINSIYAEHETEISVEALQRKVIQQLWAAGLFEEAEHYQNYREEHRKKRLAKPISEELAAQVRSDRQHFPTDLQYFQFVDKFARWLPEQKRRETWEETCFQRVLPWLFKQERVEGKLTNEEKEMLGQAMYNLEAGPAMRVVQMAGPSLDRCNVGAFNCAYAPITDIESFGELLYILMQGTGMGFSVEYDYIGDLPRIARQTGEKPVLIVVEDTTESWCEALVKVIRLLIQGRDFELDTSAVRKKGTRLLTKGGRASGPEPLHELMAFVRKVILARQGRRLTDLDVHDICCMVGNIVQVGGVRRAALISLSDLTSLDMRHAKSGDWWNGNNHRAMANNSAVYDGRPSIEVFMDEWVALVRSKSGERGICNREALERQCPERRKKGYRWGFNPCGEIQLRPRQFCNLSIAVARPEDTEETLTKKVIAATYFGTIQATCTKFGYIRKEWHNNCEEEALLGVDITGHADCPLLHPSNPDLPNLLQRLKAVVTQINQKLCSRFGINVSAALTCVKPGGDSSVFFDCASGISARFSDYQWRWCRLGKTSKLASMLIDQGVPYADAPERPSELYVFGFLKQAPKNSVKRNDVNAIQQLENWLIWKKNWAEHSVSATIYVEEHEWLAVGAWVYEHFDDITGLSFLPKDNGNYKFAPNEELSESEYLSKKETYPVIEWEKLSRYEEEDDTSNSQSFACVGGGCEG